MLRDQDFHIILTDESFERRLKTVFGDYLSICFDKLRERWVVLERALDNPAEVNLILIAEDDFGNPRPLGDWVFYALRQMKDDADKKNGNFNQYMLMKENEEDAQRVLMQQKIDEAGEYFHQHEYREWRRIFESLNNNPVSHYVQGYSLNKAAS